MPFFQVAVSLYSLVMFPAFLRKVLNIISKVYEILYFYMNFDASFDGVFFRYQAYRVFFLIEPHTSIQYSLLTKPS